MSRDLGAWLDPRIGWQIDERTAYGLNPLNIGGETDPDRPAFSRPGGIAGYEGDTSLKDAREEKARIKKEEEQRRLEIENAEKEAKKRAKEKLLDSRRQGSIGKAGTIYAGLLTEEADVKKRTLLG